MFLFFFSSRRRHTRCLSDWSSDVCSSDLFQCTDLVFESPWANPLGRVGDRKSTRLNSSHLGISYAVFCLKKKKKTYQILPRHILYRASKTLIAFILRR